jgi:hypothetical protein
VNSVNQEKILLYAPLATDVTRRRNVPLRGHAQTSLEQAADWHTSGTASLHPPFKKANAGSSASCIQPV